MIVLWLMMMLRFVVSWLLNRTSAGAFLSVSRMR